MNKDDSMLPPSDLSVKLICHLWHGKTAVVHCNTTITIQKMKKVVGWK